MMFRILGDIIKAKKISKTELASMLKRGRPYLYARLRGEEPWTLDEVYALCDLLGIATENIPLVFVDRRKYKPVDVSALLTVAGGDDK